MECSFFVHFVKSRRERGRGKPFPWSFSLF